MRSLLQRFSAHFNNDWRQIFEIGHYNWYAFHVAQIYFEFDDVTQCYELTVMALGLGFTVRYDKDFEHSLIKRLADEAYEEIKDGEVCAEEMNRSGANYRDI